MHICPKCMPAGSTAICGADSVLFPSKGPQGLPTAGYSSSPSFALPAIWQHALFMHITHGDRGRPPDAG